MAPKSTKCAIESVVMRGGTSRGPVLFASALPRDIAERDSLVVRLVGGEVSQTNGLGGGDPTTSKVVVVDAAAPSEEDVDLDYAVGNIIVGRDSVDWSGTCGNMTATVPVFALEQGLIAPTSAKRIRLRNISTGGLIDTSIRSASSHSRGDEAVVRTSYLHPAGSVFGKLLPTGKPRDTVTVDGRTFEATIVDITHPYLFLRYEEVVGANSTDDPGIVTLIEEIRATASVMLGVADSPESAMRLSPATPRVVLLHPRTGTKDGEIRVTAASMRLLIGSVPVTAAMCLAGARHVHDSLPAEFAGDMGRDEDLQVVSARARMIAAAEVDADGNLISTGVDRTARTIMSGTAWV